MSFPVPFTDFQALSLYPATALYEIEVAVYMRI